MPERDTMHWAFDDERIDWQELSELYRIAPLGEQECGASKVMSTRTACSSASCSTAAGWSVPVARWRTGCDTRISVRHRRASRDQGRGVGVTIVEQAQGALGAPPQGHSLRQSRQGGLLREARFPPHAHRDGDLSRRRQRGKDGFGRRGLNPSPFSLPSSSDLTRGSAAIPPRERCLPSPKGVSQAPAAADVPPQSFFRDIPRFVTGKGA